MLAFLPNERFLSLDEIANDEWFSSTDMPKPIEIKSRCLEIKEKIDGLNESVIEKKMEKLTQYQKFKSNAPIGSENAMLFEEFVDLTSQIVFKNPEF